MSQPRAAKTWASQYHAHPISGVNLDAHKPTSGKNSFQRYSFRASYILPYAAPLMMRQDFFTHADHVFAPVTFPRLRVASAKISWLVTTRAECSSLPAAFITSASNLISAWPGLTCSPSPETVQIPRPSNRRYQADVQQQFQAVRRLHDQGMAAEEDADDFPRRRLNQSIASGHKAHARCPAGRRQRTGSGNLPDPARPRPGAPAVQ